MSQGFRQLKDRIKSIQSTRKITRAMEMVSASKLNRVKSQYLSARTYMADLERVVFSFISDISPAAHPLLIPRERINNIVIAAFTSDAGLCSTYNNNVIKAVCNFSEVRSKEKIKIIAVGKEAFSYFKREGYDVVHSYIGMRGKFSQDNVNDIAGMIKEIYLSGKADEAYLAYTHFSPNLRHRCAIEKLFNIAAQNTGKKYYIVEPDAHTLLDELLSKYVNAKMRMVLLDSLTAEHSARMLAMKLATDNADELIDTLTLLKNKARQAAITKEVLEIASSAEALKG